MKKLTPAFLLFALLGCTTVSITDTGGNVSVSRHFGAITIELNPGSKTVLAETTGLGYLTGPLGTTLGFAKSSIAAIGDSCKLVLWVSDKSQIEQLEQILGNPESICVISSTK